MGNGYGRYAVCNRKVNAGVLGNLGNLGNQGNQGNQGEWELVG
jgi:hypothetical protein